MGQPKLLLKVAGKSIIRHLLDALNHPDISSISVLVRKSDHALTSEIEQTTAKVITGETDPVDMLESIKRLLHNLKTSRQLRSEHQPHSNDSLLLIPGDYPLVEQSVLSRLLSAWRVHSDKIIVPVHRGRRGHPTIFPWSLVSRMDSIPENQGLNWLFRHSIEVIEIDFEEASVLQDIDTPQDFKAIRSQLESKYENSSDS